MNFSQKIKKIFPRPISFLFLGIFLSLFFLFPLAAKAGVWDTISGAIFAIPNLMIFAALALLLLISQIFVLFAGALVDWVVSPSFISISYTNPSGPNGNPIVGIGLDITKSFVSLVLVVILIYIAVAIALRLGEANAKKIFAKLILIALLVNFAPVLVGLIVDASNIVMNYFLKGIEVGISNVITQYINLASGLISKLLSLRIFTFSGQTSLIAQVLVLLLLNTGTALALSLFVALFIFRYIAIWILVILSPLAFVAWILPATKKYWDMWWNQLIQWSIIGIPIAFFLYLGARCYEVLPTIYRTKATIPTLKPEVTDLFNQTFPYFVVLAFLYLGFTIGLQTGAMGASGVIGLTKKHGWAAAKWTGGQSRRLAGRMVGARGKKWMQRQASAQLPGKTLLGKVAWGVGTLGAAPAYWAARRGIGEAGIHLTETGRKDIRGAEEKYEGTIAEKKVSAMRDVRFGWANRIAALRQGVEEGQIDDIKRIMGPTADEEITKIGRAALRVHSDEFKKIRDAFPHLAKEMGEGFSTKIRSEAKVMPFKEYLTELNAQAAGLDAQIRTLPPGTKRTLLMETERKEIHDLITGVTKDQEEFGTVEAKIVAKVKPAFVPKMDEKSLTTPEAEYAMHKFWHGNQYRAAVDALGRKFVDRFNKVAEDNLAKEPNYYEKNNYPLYKFSGSSPGVSLGIKTLE